MTNFENLLLKTGSPDLICAFISEYEKSLSQDFMQHFVVYSQEVEKKFAYSASTESAKAVISDLMQMKIKDFLQTYGTGLSTTIKTRIQRHLEAYLEVRTVQELLKYSRDDIARVYNLGRKSVNMLEEALKAAGLKFAN